MTLASLAILIMIMQFRDAFTTFRKKTRDAAQPRQAWLATLQFHKNHNLWFLRYLGVTRRDKEIFYSIFAFQGD